MTALLCAIAAAHAQTYADRDPRSATAATGVQTASPAGLPAAASLRGFVVDADGAGLAGAQVDFSEPGVAAKTVLTGSNGGFQLDGIPAGAFHLTVTAAGFAPGAASGSLEPGQHAELPTIVLGAGATEAVDVTISRHEVATEEVHAEEHQRLGGVIPNFFVVYDRNAPPLTARQKFELSWKTIIDPVTLGITSGIAGLQQSAGGLDGYGPGAAGYGKRLGADLADGTLGNLLGGAILPSLFHQDPRYFYRGTGTVRSRFFYALSTAVIAKGDNGKWQPAYAGVTGDFAAGALSNLYYPADERNGIGLTLENGFLAVALDGAQNVIQEFLLKHLTPKVPIYNAP